MLGSCAPLELGQGFGQDKAEKDQAVLIGW